MSGIALLWHRDGSPLRGGSTDHQRMMVALAHRGGDGADTRRTVSLCLGHQHSWDTPEEVGERQPLRSEEGGFDLVFDGRLDDREGLCRMLGDRGGASRSDADLVAAAYHRWGVDACSRLLGPFALVVADHRRQQVVCARDALGDRRLVYHASPRLLVVASEERAVLAHSAVADQPDEAYLAAVLAIRLPAVGSTCFAAVRELPAAHVMVCTRNRLRLHRYWQLEPDTASACSDHEHVERFRELLERSVRARMRCRSRVAVLMSGGMDSTSVAAFAARTSSTPVPAISWHFPERESNETEFITAAAAHLGLEPVPVDGRELWPLCRTSRWLTNPNLPAESFSRALYDRSYREAGQRGAAVLLTGDFGDHLFAGSDHWLRAMIAARRLAGIPAAIAAHAYYHGLRRFYSTVPLRRAIARAIGARREPQSGQAPPPPWLTPFAAAELARSAADPPHATPAASDRVGTLLDRWTEIGIAAETWHAAHAGIEIRRPYRDRRLVEMACGLPAHLLFRPGESKTVLRRAMRGLLPEQVRTRRRLTTLAPVVLRGLADRASAEMTSALRRGETWPRYVRSQWLWKTYPATLRPGVAAPAVLVPWLCLCVDTWSRHAADVAASTSPAA